MTLAKEVLSFVENLNEEFDVDIYRKIGIWLREASYFNFDPLDSERGTYLLTISVANKPIIKIATKFDEDGNMVLDKAEPDEMGIEALVELIEEKHKELKGEGDNG